MRLKQPLVLAILFLTFGMVAQESNIFHDRTYWRGNPSIADIEEKIKEGNDISSLNRSAFDAVSWALIEKVDNKTVKHLLGKKGNGVNKLTHDGRTYIFWAAYKDNLEMMRYLVSKGAKTDIIDSHGYSVLNFAATTGQLNTALYDFCIQHGSDPVSEKNHDGANALLLVAPFIKDIALIDYFTSKGVPLHSKDNDGNGIFNYAAKTGNMSLMNYLIKKGMAPKGLNKIGGNAMIFASRGTRNKTNTLETFTYLEKQGVIPNVVTKKGVTPLHGFANKGKELAVYNYFIKKGVDINQADENGNTVFHYAARGNQLEVIRLLSSYLKDINAQNKKGQTALMYALQRNTPKVVHFLISKKASVNTVDKEGYSLGYYLIQSYNPKKLAEFKVKAKLLEDSGYSFTNLKGNENSLFHYALDKNNMDLLKWVHAMGINVNTKNKEGITPLQKAAMTAKNDKILKYLLRIGADKTVKTDFDETVYALASENELLKKNKVDIQFLK